MPQRPLPSAPPPVLPVFWATALLCLLTVLSSAQNLPHIGYVYPAGGRQGSVFQVVVGGQYLLGVSNAWISGPGIQATVLEYNRPLTQKEVNDLREQLKTLQDKKNATNAVWTADDQKAIRDIRLKLATQANNRQQGPAIAETAILRIEVAGNAVPGQHELRLGTTNGLSNPLRFYIGQLPEFTHRAATCPPDASSTNDIKPRVENKAVAPTEMEVTSPCIINGQILPGEVDHFRFAARRGQRLVIAVSARELIPYLADAVPGWFQAAVTLYDPAGRELAYADHFLFHPDPVLCYDIPRDGEYRVAIHDSVYRGREDFVYRISLGELPWVTSAFPLGGPSGSNTTVSLDGWNLSQTQLVFDATAKGPGLYPLWGGRGAWLSNPEQFAVDTLPECAEVEPNDRPETAQAVTLPIIINGHIDRPGDQDVFRFDAHGGDSVIAEISARHLDSQLDSVLRLTDAEGKQLAFNDDYEDKGEGLNTHHADSWLQAVLPADGTYYLYLADAEHQGGPAFGYRLRISPPRPDFALRIAPSSLTVRPGASVAATVYALRRDGFTNEIQVRLVGVSAGFKLGGATVPANRDQVRLTLTAPTNSQNEPFDLKLEGHARVAGREVTRPVVPVEDMMQAFSYRHLVPAQEFKVAIRGRYIPKAVVRILSPTPVRIPVDGTATVRLSLPGNALSGKVRLELSDAPEGIEIQSVSPSAQATEITLFADAQVKAGLKGNLIINAYADKPPAAGAGKQVKRQRAAISALPAIPFETVSPQ